MLRESIASRPVRVAVIGCGKMGRQHLKAIRRVANATIVGVADPALDAELLRDLLPPDAVARHDPAAMLSEAAPDVVHIVTPPATHFEMTSLALRHGCHAYVEKPFTTTTREAEQLLALAAERRLMLCPGHQVLFEKPSLAALDAAGTIGRLSHIQSYFSFRTARASIAPVDQARDILPHAAYLLLEHMRHGTHVEDDPIEVVGVDVRATGDVYALLRLGQCTGVLMVTLTGRPVEHYLELVGTGGSLRADFVTGGLLRLLGPGAGVGVLATPFRRATQTLTGATRGIAALALRRTSYAGLDALVHRFYTAIQAGGQPPVLPRSILDTVSVCERLGTALDAAEQRAEAQAAERLAREVVQRPAPTPGRGVVLVTGAAGLLGRRVVAELRQAGFAVRAAVRRTPRLAVRVAGVEYVATDLSRPLHPGVMADVRHVVHCAAATSGGRADHQRDSIDATRHVIEAASRAGVESVVHVSSLAVLAPGRRFGPGLDEDSPLDAGEDRGPYVWGKLESERLARQRGAELGVKVAVVRPGPLVDFTDFSPPGRLGRELGPIFVAVGGRRTPLSVCDVGTAARVIRLLVERPDEAPPVVNLVEAPAPRRRDLVRRLRSARPDLRIVWLPASLLRVASGTLKLLLRLRGAGKPLDLYAAFAGARYRADLAARLIDRAGRVAASPPALPIPPPTGPSRPAVHDTSSPVV